MSEPRPTYAVTEWHGCYDDSWNGVLVPDAFAHPAKFAPGLISRILRHMLERGYIAPGDSIVDPFGGIAAGGYWAMLLGLHWTGVELEPRFVELGQRNIAKWQHDLRGLGSRLGTARLLQGDSRRLLEVVGGGAAGVVSSPPFESSLTTDSKLFTPYTGLGRYKYSPEVAERRKEDYGSTPGQLGSMPSGDYAAAVGSPPYSGDALGHDAGTVRLDAKEDARRAVEGSFRRPGYGAADGQLGTMKTGDFTAAVSSPPYADAVNGSGEGPGARHDPIYHNGDNAFKASSANGYGTTPGNLGSMAGEGFEAAVSSPPYEARTVHGDARGMTRLGEKGGAVGRWGSHASGEMAQGDYGDAQGNIGNDTGETFWSAARQIVEQTYSVLRPGGYAVWVTKDFVRRGQRVPFSDQWEQLCAAVGFEPVERIHALLVDDHGEQLDIFGGATARRKERKSFFRRLAEKNGSPRIDHEDVIIMRRPL